LAADTRPIGEPMTFTRSSNYHLVSDCKRYTIAKVFVNAVLQYEAWHKPEKGTAVLVAGKLIDSTAAIEACHAHEQTAKAA
jgi:hypothetical protein